MEIKNEIKKVKDMDREINENDLVISEDHSVNDIVRWLQSENILEEVINIGDEEE